MEILLDGKSFDSSRIYEGDLFVFDRVLSDGPLHALPIDNSRSFSLRLHELVTVDGEIDQQHQGYLVHEKDSFGRKRLFVFDRLCDFEMNLILWRMSLEKSGLTIRVDELFVDAIEVAERFGVDLPGRYPKASADIKEIRSASISLYRDMLDSISGILRDDAYDSKKSKDTVIRAMVTALAAETLAVCAFGRASGYHRARLLVFQNVLTSVHRTHPHFTDYITRYVSGDPVNPKLCIRGLFYGISLEEAEK